MWLETVNVFLKEVCCVEHTSRNRESDALLNLAIDNIAKKNSHHRMIEKKIK